MNKLKQIIIRYYERLCIWFSYYRVSNKVYDFDSYGILELEKHQLTRVYKCIKKYHYHEDSEYNLHWLKIMLNILDLVLDYRNKPPFVKQYVNLRNYKRYIPNVSSEDIQSNRDYAIYLLYNKKLWYIYSKLRYNYLLNWWE